MGAESRERAGRRLVLVRHGQTAWNAEQRAQGHVDVVLDETGRAQSELMARTLAAHEPELLVSSDLARARETAAFLEKETGLTALEDARLREYDLGEHTGLTVAELGEQMGAERAGWWDLHVPGAVPGAETSTQVLGRVRPALLEVLGRLDAGQTAVVVMHGASLRVGIAGLLGWPIEATSTLAPMHNCAWAMLSETATGQVRLAAYNLTVAGGPPD